MPGSTRQPPRKFRRARRSHLGLWTIVVLAVLAVAYAGVLAQQRPHVNGDRLRYDEFLNAATATPPRIVDATFLDEDSYVVGHFRREADSPPVAFNSPVPRAAQEDAVRLLGTLRIPFSVDPQTTKRIGGALSVALPVFMLLVIFGYFLISMRRGTGLFSVKSGATKGTRYVDDVRFADIAGQDAAIKELREVGEYLSDPTRFAAIGARVPRGVLLYGPPGCGKTMLAKALATETKATFLSISGSNFVELYVGVGASRVRDLFRAARESAPAIIFVDELDSLGRARGLGGDQHAHSEQEQALNQFLAEMDGCAPTSGIIVIGATNRPDILDQALLRPGRFDRTIGLERPDERARLAILKVHAAKKTLTEGVDLAAVAHRAIGLTGAELANVLNEAALAAARDRRPAITQADLDAALEQLLQAPEQQRKLALRPRSIGTRFAGSKRVGFADVAGQKAAVLELEEIKQFLVDPARYEAVGAELPKGVLLFGPPGCGKTLLARALAGEANAAFFSVGASEFVETFVGQGAARVRDLFAEARSMPPAIIFIDELDSVGRTRVGTGAARGGGEQEQALNQLLTEMDGFSAAQGVLVLAATNRPDVLDPALLRPGRFDRSVSLRLPDEQGRLEILELHARGKPLAADTNLAALARQAIGLTGADLAKAVNEAALLSARVGRLEITQAALDESLRRILAAPAEQRRNAMRARSIGTRVSSEAKVTFANVAGAGDALAELAEVKACLADPERFRRVGARAPHGILLSGPPGCGKTLLARAVAGEANAAFFAVAGSEFVEVFVGEGAARVRDLFAEAKAMAPSMVFIDEIDAIGARRSAGHAGHRELEQTLNQILVELDGFEPSAAMVVMAATNRPDILDPALVRPGRFDRRVEVRLPDRSGRLEILGLHARGKRFATDVDFNTLAALTSGFSGADLANVLNEAALLAARYGGDEITMALVDEAIDRAMLGITSRATIMTAEERQRVAFHEAGHALVSLARPDVNPPHKVTIVPRGASLGHCSAVGEPRVLISKSMFLDRMAVLLGGLVAEEMVYGESTSAPAADLEEVGDIARDMVRRYGMSSELGPLAYPAPAGADGRRGSYSDASARLIDDEVRRLVLAAKDRAGSAIAPDALNRVAAELFKRETLTRAELESLVAIPPAAPRPVGAPRPRASRKAPASPSASPTGRR